MCRLLCNNGGGKIGTMAKLFMDNKQTLEINQLEIDLFINIACM